jgi:phosphoglycerate dehydrogenase-like enzyme
MLAFRWNLPTMERLKARAEWAQGRWDRFARPELRGSTLGIIGYGAIGRELARQAQALGMRVLAANRSGQRHPQRGFNEPGVGDPDGVIPEKMYATAQLKQMLPECDYVASAIPLTGETRHLLNAGTFAAMKKSAFFFNVGRGQVVDEAALVVALQQGQLAGAGLDVFEQEPLPPESPLWRLEQVIISPHVSGFTPRYDARASELFAENLRRYLKQEPLLNLVDREKGY